MCVQKTGREDWEKPTKWKVGEIGGEEEKGVCVKIDCEWSGLSLLLNRE